MLTYHTGEALTLALATGDTTLQADVTPRAARYALLAGERALGLDTTTALDLLDRAKTLTAEQDPGFPLVLLRWAEAARQAGRVLEAAEALREGRRCLTAIGDPGADVPLRQARALFDQMHARPRVDECAP